MKAVNKEIKKDSNKLSKVTTVLALSAGFAIACSMILKFFPEVSLATVWQTYLDLNSATKTIIISAAACILFAIKICAIGCLIQLKKNSSARTAALKLNQLEEIVKITKLTISDYEDWMFENYYYADNSTIERLAPAKWVLNALEQKLNTINKNIYQLSNRQLNQILDLPIEIKKSAINMIVFNDICLELPARLSFLECAYIIKQVFDSVKGDIQSSNKAAPQRRYFDAPICI